MERRYTKKFYTPSILLTAELVLCVEDGGVVVGERASSLCLNVIPPLVHYVTDRFGCGCPLNQEDGGTPEAARPATANRHYSMLSTREIRKQ